MKIALYGQFTPTTPTRPDSRQQLSRVGVVGVKWPLARATNANRQTMQANGTRTTVDDVYYSIDYSAANVHTTAIARCENLAS